jgi:hypothetical protein
MTFYECKDAAGKIMPAIASTNSIAAALQAISITGAISANNSNKSGKPKYMAIKGYSNSDKI